MEKRIVIPVCKKHGKFQTNGGRWLSIKEDLESHIAFTGSQDAILSEGECDECEDPMQTQIVFEKIVGIILMIIYITFR